jgi:hypothetical protein
MREIVAHLLGTERVMVGRAVRVLEEDDPELASVSWTETVAGEPASIADLVAPAPRAAAADAEQVRLARARGVVASGPHPEWGR